jgi:hypothetical protein
LMTVPTFQINISGNVVAFYGAAVATVLGVFQIINFLRDRRKVKITVRSNTEYVSALAIPNDCRGDDGDDPYTTITVANAGRRPVTITGIGGYRLYQRKGFLVWHCPSLPQELTEGKHLTAFVDETEYDLTDLECWEVYDAVGHTHRLKVAPFYGRWASRLWRKWLRRGYAKKMKNLTAG